MKVVQAGPNLPEAVPQRRSPRGGPPEAVPQRPVPQRRYPRGTPPHIGGHTAWDPGPAAGSRPWDDRPRHAQTHTGGCTSRCDVVWVCERAFMCTTRV